MSISEQRTTYAKSGPYGLDPSILPPPRRRRFAVPGWFGAIVAGVLAIAGVSVALSPLGIKNTSAVVRKGERYHFPDEVKLAVAFWEAQDWPRKTRNPRYENPASGATGIIASAGIYFDDSHELRDFIAANFPGAVITERQFLHFDVAWRPNRRAIRTDPASPGAPVNRRLIYDAANGLIFYTPDHYATIYLYARDNDAFGPPGAAPPAEAGEEAPPTEDVGPDMDADPTCTSGLDGACPATDRAYLAYWADALGDRDRIVPGIHARQAALIGAFVARLAAFAP